MFPLAQAFDGMQWLPFILLLLGAGTVLGVLGLGERIFSTTYSGNSLSSWAIGFGICNLLLIAIVSVGPNPVVYLFAATPIAIGVATRFIPRRMSRRGFLMLAARVFAKAPLDARRERRG